MYDIARLPSSIDIGYSGEKSFRTIEIDMTKWMQEMPDGIPSIVHIRPTETSADAYSPTTTFAENILRWEITDADAAISGSGVAQVWLQDMDDGSLARRGKSATFATRINLSINDPSETPPSAQESWFEEVMAESAAVKQANTDIRLCKEFVMTNDFDSGIVKQNVLETPYNITEVITGHVIYSNGTIQENTIGDVSPLIPVSQGTYGLKTVHSPYIGNINNGNSYKNGYGFFASDGTTVVARPETLLHNVDTDIFVFDVPEGAVYVRFCYMSGTNYRDDALEYFNQWILLPDANDDIDASFFVLGQKKNDKTIDQMERGDGSLIHLNDARVGNLSNLNTVDKSSVVNAINEALITRDPDGAAKLWLKKNNLDAEVGGKVNVLTTPYEISDIELNKQILSNGNIGDFPGGGFDVTPLIPISKGTYGLKTVHSTYLGKISDGNNYKNGYGFFAANGTTVVNRPTTLLHEVTTDIYVFDVPEDAAYVRFTYTSGASDTYKNDALAYFNQWILLPDANDDIDASWFVVSPKKENGEINKLFRIDNSYLEIVDIEAREKAQEALNSLNSLGSRTCAIFRKVCCIGDSYTAGYIMNSSGTAHDAPDFSWVKHLENITGREYVNCGISGATTASWLTNQNGLAKAQVAANKAQAYIIGLQINDAETGLTVGTVSDIGTNTQSYYGCTSKIIDEVFEINDDAHVFLLTQPKNYTGIHTPYRAAILDIVDWYQTEGNGTHQGQVHLIDLLTYYKLFLRPGCSDSSANGHYTAVGWEYTAEIIALAWSEYLNAHPLLFQDVNLIPYGTAT